MDLDRLMAAGQHIDPDGDGVVSAKDNCSGIANADQADADGNGFGDVCDPGEAPPLGVRLTSPQPGAEFPVEGRIPLVATSAVIPAEIARVSFYANRSFICEARVAPFQCIWQPTAVGTYVLSAVAVSRKGFQGRSPDVSVIVK